VKTNKEHAWIDFSRAVEEHIRIYAVPQYGDTGSELNLVDEYTAQDCINAIKKYAIRHGKNCRHDHDYMDLLKIAHYAQMAADKLLQQEK
jgi:hypothetical protein